MVALGNWLFFISDLRAVRRNPGATAEEDTFTLFMSFGHQESVSRAVWEEIAGYLPEVQQIER